MPSCAVSGCESQSSVSTDCTFHRLPNSPIPRSRWMLALGRLPHSAYVCSRHFDESMFTKQGNMKMLKPDAVPKVLLDSLPNVEQCPNLSECSDEVRPSGELVACRVCLMVDGRLYAISGTGLEDLLAALTGVVLSAEESMPRHLCVFCLAKLSKFAAFRDSCQRSTTLLQTLRGMGRLKMNAIRAYNQMSRQLKTNLTVSNVFQFGTVPLLEITPLLKTQVKPNLHEEEFTEVEHLESEDITKKDAHSDDGDGFTCSFKSPVHERVKPKIKRVKLSTKTPKSKKDGMEAESPGTLSGLDDCDTVEKNSASLKTEFDLAFEKEFNFEITVLNKEEQKQKIKERKRNSKSVYSCDVCGKGYLTEGTLMKHRTCFHDQSSPFECDVCRCRFRRRDDLAKHREIHRAVFTCAQCHHVCFSRKRARDHYLTHKGSKYKCPHCDIVYDRPCSYYGHVRLHHPDKNEACDECGETFIGEMGLKMHKRLRHWTNDKSRLNSKCKVCKVTFLSAEALQRHEVQCKGASHALWPCAACGKSCASDAARAEHAAETHPPGQLHCQECDKTFSDSASFALHVERKHQKPQNTSRRRRALGPRPLDGPTGRLICEICGKVASCPATLEYHMNGHLGLKPFQCPLCPKAFASQFKHMLHMRSHTGERPYKCEHCPRTFAFQGNYQRHVKCVHLRVQVTCDKCGKMVGLASLPSHVRAVHMKMPYVRRKRDRTKKKLNLATES